MGWEKLLTCMKKTTAAVCKKGGKCVCGRGIKHRQQAGAQARKHWCKKCGQFWT